MSYKIGSFNIENLGYGALDTKEDKNKERDLRKIAEIIRKEDFDIVAFQEIKSEGKAFWGPGTSSKQGILFELGPRWEFWPSKNNNVRENTEFAFVWKKDRIELIEGNNPCVTEYRKRGDSIELVRNPIMARFSPLHLPKLEIRLIDIHLYFGKNTLNDIERRKKEFQTMIREILNKYDDKRYGDNKQAFTFALGDYNLNLPVVIPDNRDTSALIKNEIEIDNKVIKTVQYDPTTIKSKELNGSTSNKEVSVEVENVKIRKILDDAKTIMRMNENYWSNNYDHFSYNSAYENKANITDQRINVIAKYCGNDFISYQEKVSDHVPIALTIDLN